MSVKNQDASGLALIAVVDDDEDVRAALQGLLGSMGYDSEPFESADSLLNSPNCYLFDCIISDVQMPGISGLEMARRIQPRQTPVILITAFPTADVVRLAKEAGVRKLLTKPFDSGDLVDQLTSLFG